MAIGPVTRSEHRRAVAEWHSHHKAAVGERLALGAFVGDALVATAVWSDPVAPALRSRWCWEMTRLAVGPDAPPHTASRLLGAATRAALALGLRRLVSYTRADERGTCYRAAGWHPTAHVPAEDWHRRRQSTPSAWLPGLFVPSAAPVDRVRWERGPSADAPAWELVGL